MRAAKIVLARVPDAKFVFVGSGPAEKALHELATTLGVEGSVQLVGKIEDRAELEGYYASSRMLVIPFRGRGGYILTLAALESLTVGRPVIAAYEVEATPGVIQTSNEPVIMAQRIIELLMLNDADYAVIARAARATVDRLGGAQVSSDVEDAYFKLVQPSK
jgi:glycosyltransferase involved in cell wall biosynthesis